MITCPTCSAPNEAGAGVCQRCGNNLTQLAAHGALQPTTSLSLAKEAHHWDHICPNCGVAILVGEVICNNCGAALHPKASSARCPGAPLPSATPVGHTAQLMISNGQPVILSGKNTYLIGRADQAGGIFPDVDTTASGGEAAGVAHRHAEIREQQGRWFLQTTNAMHDTFVNQQKVTPNVLVALNAGDQIQLGQWVATFQL